MSIYKIISVKWFFLWISFCFIFFKISAQRYLDNVFSAVDSITNISYGSAPDYLNKTQNLLLDFYEPKDDTAKERALLIYVHGGGFKEGTRKWPSIKIICEKMALKGYAVASIDYRLDSTFNVFLDTNRRAMTDAMHDLKAAIRFFKKENSEYRIDTNKIFAGGESAGAITTMMATYIDKKSELAPYPGTKPDNVEGESGNAGFASQPDAALCLCGLGDTLAMGGFDDPPFLWIHGSADPLINIDIARNVLIRADNIHLPHKSYIFKGATHCPWYFGLPDWQKYLDSTVNMIAEFLFPFAKSTALLLPLKDSGNRKFAFPQQKEFITTRVNHFFANPW